MPVSWKPKSKPDRIVEMFESARRIGEDGKVYFDSRGLLIDEAALLWTLNLQRAKMVL